MTKPIIHTLLFIGQPGAPVATSCFAVIQKLNKKFKTESQIIKASTKENSQFNSVIFAEFPIPESNTIIHLKSIQVWEKDNINFDLGLFSDDLKNTFVFLIPGDSYFNEKIIDFLKKEQCNIAMRKIDTIKEEGLDDILLSIDNIIQHSILEKDITITKNKKSVKL